MKKITASLESVSKFSTSRFYNVPKLDREQPSDYEKRTWRERLHVNREGYVYIPGIMFKNCIAGAAKYMSLKIPGKRNATYTKHFEAGVMCLDDLVLPIKKDEVEGEWLFVPSNGQRGGGTRVEKCFPAIHEWSGDVEFLIADEIITEDVFKEHLKAAGMFIGLGFWRPRNGGTNGRFKVNGLKTESM